MDLNEPLIRIGEAARTAADAVGPALSRASAGVALGREKLRGLPVGEVARAVPAPPSLRLPRFPGPLHAADALVERRRRRTRGIQLGQEAVARRRLSGDRRGEAIKLNALGREYRRRGRHAEAIVCYTQALTIFRELGNRRGEGLSLSNLGLAYADQGNRAKAIRCLEDALDVFRLLGDAHVEGQILANLGTTYRRQGQADRAHELWNEALSLIVPGTSAHRLMSDRLGAVR